MIGPRIADRMRDFFERQLAWLARWSAELPDEAGAYSEADWERLAESFPDYFAELRQLEEEFFLLEREWQEAGDITDEERAAITRLAQEARGGAERMARWFQESAQRAADDREDVRDELQALRRSSGAMRKYFGERRDDRGDRMDREA